ncbi:hypothetical protein [Spirosoma terrae]|uniref:Uncharacterized protein n=1 Tax=Spirosoma terrae TaxID=1968276 RepID=A0A6L9L9M4_9BACT|nr:hypothetical protein [Spirosoma terrae]NDU97266.1 hypothetical protein [Spirosoma terrae]
MILFYLASGLILIGLLVYLYLHISLSMRCPKCRKINNERIPRSSIARLFSRFLPLKAYRCRTCWNQYVVISD